MKIHLICFTISFAFLLRIFTPSKIYIFTAFILYLHLNIDTLCISHFKLYTLYIYHFKFHTLDNYHFNINTSYTHHFNLYNYLYSSTFTYKLLSMLDPLICIWIRRLTAFKGDKSYSTQTVIVQQPQCIVISKHHAYTHTYSIQKSFLVRVEGK